MLALLSAIAPLATDMYLPALPEVADDLVTSAPHVQLTLTTFLVGLAAGQLTLGPLSDAWGRRRLMLAGSVLCALATVACALAPSIEVLAVARFVQGFGGAAGVVLSRAVIVDRTTGDRTARLFTVMMAIQGIAPVVAPLIGGVLLRFGEWRIVFVVLAVITAAMVVGVLLCVPETLPAHRRTENSPAQTVRNIVRVLRRHRFLGYALGMTLSFATLFAYISASPFVLQDVLGLTTTQYTVAFAANATGLVTASTVSARLTGRVSPRVLLLSGVAVLVVASGVLLAVALAGAPRWPLLAVLFAAVSSLGFIMGNAAALAAREAADLAGTASALLGALQFAFGATVSPLVGSSPVVMGAVMLACSGLAATALLSLTRRAVRPGRPVPAG